MYNKMSIKLKKEDNLKTFKKSFINQQFFSFARTLKFKNLIRYYYY